MKKSLFAGLEILEAGDSLSSDNGAFIGVDRETIDRLLRIGAKTHRHTGLSGLSNPLVAPGASVVASAGTISSDTAISVGYTLEDNDGGETMISPVTVVSTQPPLSAPQFAPSAASNYASGSLLVNTYFYALTYGDGEGGETQMGPSVNAERAPGFASGRVILTNLTHDMVSLGASEWRLYRAIGGGVFNLLATGSSSEDTFIDDGTHSLDCSTHPPAGELNTTAGVSTLLVTLPSAIGGATSINLYGTVTGDFGGGSLLGSYPAASAGHVAAFQSLELGAHSPPSVNLSIGGAHQIDPESELLSWHWRGPVAASAALPSGTLGDVRLVTGDGTLWGILSASAAGATGWTRLASAGAVVASAAVQLWTPVVTTGVKQLSPTSFEKVSGGAAEGQVYSAESYTGGCFVSWRVSQANAGLGFGLNVDPTLNADFTSIDYFLNCTAAGTILIRENGVEVGTFGSYSTGDTFAITYNARKVRYWKNGKVLREVARSLGEPLFLDSWWNNVGGKVTEVSFGPMATAGPALVASAASGVPGGVSDVEKITFAGSGIVQVKASEPNIGEVLVTITASAAPGASGGGGGAGAIAVNASGSAASPANVAEALKLELIGSAGVNLKETEPEGKKAKVVVEGQSVVLANEGVGVLICKTSEKGRPRPTAYRTYIWYCKEKPTNMAEYDQWVEEGP